MVRTIDQALETVPWWAGNAQLTNLSGKLTEGAYCSRWIDCAVGRGNDFI